MPARITTEVLEAYLHCKVKGHLKLTGHTGAPPDYAQMQAEARQAVRANVIKTIQARHQPDEVLLGVPLAAASLRAGPLFVFDTTSEDDQFALAIDGLKRVDGPSELGGFHYIPMLFHEGQNVRPMQRLQLEVVGRILATVQGRPPGNGIVWCGSDCKSSKIRMNLDTRTIDRFIRELKEFVESRTAPTLVLNDHCQICEFRDRCRGEALANDDLSLLRSLTAPEIQKYNKRGVFAVTQLAYAFRPRRQRLGITRHDPSLKALAVRDRKVYFYGEARLPADCGTRVYLDVEGDLRTQRAYLIGMLVSKDGVDHWHSLWADSSAEEPAILAEMLQILEAYQNPTIYHYGQFDVACLKRMAAITKTDHLIGHLIARAVNVLAIVHKHVYFPTYSNGLKDIGSYLGCSWTDADAAGIQAVVWRAEWQKTGNRSFRDRLVQYNREDCLALKCVTEFIYRNATRAAADIPPADDLHKEVAVARADGFVPVSAKSIWNQRSTSFPDFERLNRCAYFDYQRQHVFVRTNKTLKRIRRRKSHRRPAALRPNKCVAFVVRQCPHCGGKRLKAFASRKSKLVLDLIINLAGARRYVTKCEAPRYQCLRCERTFRSPEYVGLDRHGHALKSWAIYQHIVHRTSFHRLSEMFRDLFGLPFHACDLRDIKELLVQQYQPAYELLLQRMLSGEVLHADETAVRLKKGSGYIWVFTDFERVVYFYRPDRKGLFLRDFLKDFRGVLVSDFYGAYDGLPCRQQKCIIHLMRDMNTDLLKNPFDGEFKDVVAAFSSILSAAVATIDQHGLKARYLKRHKRGFEHWVLDLSQKCFQSQVAESFRDRILRNKDRLFTFAEHDGVPWNNSNAEHAIRGFTINRDQTNGCWKEPGLQSYLMLLSLRQTCAYQGVNFLDFLLSREMDVGEFARHPKRRRSTPHLESYPIGFIPSNRGPVRSKS